MDAKFAKEKYAGVNNRVRKDSPEKNQRRSGLTVNALDFG